MDKPTKKRLTVRRVDHLLRAPRPVMLIDRILARSSVAIIAAPSYMGKTFLALEAARSVVYAEPFLGHFPVSRPGNVLYLGNDSPDWDIASQFDKLIGLPDPKLEDVATLLAETPLGSFGFVFDPSFMLNSAGDADMVVDAAQRFYNVRDVEVTNEGHSYRDVRGTDLIIIDTLRSVHGFEENDNTAMQHMMNLLRYISIETKAAVLALHHFNKGTQESPAAHLDRLRGATSIGGAVDTVYALTGKAPSIAVRVLKNRPCPEQGDFMYEMATTKDGMDLRIAAPEGVVNVGARAAIITRLADGDGWVKTGELEAAVSAVSPEMKEKAVKNAVTKVLGALERAGTIARIHGAARLTNVKLEVS